jgi:hypothetical protein
MQYIVKKNVSAGRKLKMAAQFKMAAILQLPTEKSRPILSPCLNIKIT